MISAREVTKSAAERFLSRVNSHVTSEVVLIFGFIGTVGTLVIVFFQNANVLLVERKVCERLPTPHTSDVGSHLNLKLEWIPHSVIVINYCAPI